MTEEVAAAPPAPTPIERHEHTPNALAILEPKGGTVELIITTVARETHIYHLTYQQVCLMASDSELARINLVKANKAKEKVKK